MDIVTASLLGEFVKEHGLEALKEDSQFEHFCTYAVVHRSFSGETFNTHDLVVGAGGDTGIDAIAIFVNGTLITDMDQLEELCSLSGQLDVAFVFVQAERSSSFDAMKIGNLGFGVADFFSQDPKLKRNDRVIASAEMAQMLFARSSKFSPGNPVVRMFYLTTGKWVDETDLVNRQEAQCKDLYSTEAFRDVTFESFGAARLQKLYRETRNVVNRDFEFKHNVSVPSSEGVQEAFIGYLPWSQFLRIVADDAGTSVNSTLFFDNVRDWLGETPVNSEIKGTLESPRKARFALMNNGVTIIARAMKRTSDTFHISDYSIVNGCQTSNALFAARESLDDSVSVPIRLIHTQDEEIINDIIRSTNLQTPVTEEQFFGLQEFPKQLEQYFQSAQDPQRKLYFERRDRQYDRLSIEKTRIVTNRDMVKAFASMFLNEPHSATRSYGSLRERVGGQIYAKDSRMEPYLLAALALYKLEFMFRNGKVEPRFKPARFHIIMAVRIIAAGWKMPSMNSNQMEKYCAPVIDQLWTNPDTLITKAVQAIQLVANDNMDRDNIRTEQFTHGVINYLLA
ncbi:AIPR family protein [Caenimonas sedimenti]|uniref:AIPR family protein n=1 Tax=Caenimonas sedimenti TaxID=2596921 RepID=A0A562ZGT7_9BURK|nr:AIPR family protein [Caenimonas sedimenti]TWO67790.1 AIPR family protein [Caenimonas sedimenti]